MLKFLIKQSINLSSTIKKDIYCTKNNILTNFKHGYQIGKNYSNKKDFSKLQTIFVSNKCAIKKLKITKNDYPAIGAFLGTCSPIPGGTAIGYTLGKFCSKI